MKQRVGLRVLIALFCAICVICGLQGSVAALLAAGQGGLVVQQPQAVALLNQSLTAVGGVQGLAGISDFLATGTITYYWADQPVAGTATVRGRGFDQFRLDAVIPGGTRSYAVSHGVGALEDTTGTVTAIPYFNTVNIAILSFPYPEIIARLADPLTAITDLGLVTNAL